MEESKKGKRKRDRNRGKTRVNGLTFTWCRALQCCVKVCPLVDMCFLWLVSYLYKVQLYFSLCCVVSYWCFNEVGYCHCVLHGLLQCLCTLPPCVKDIFFFFVYIMLDRECVSEWYYSSPTWLQVLMSTPPFRYSKTLSMFPALAARRKLVLLSDWRRQKKNTFSKIAHIIVQTTFVFCHWLSDGIITQSFRLNESQSNPHSMAFKW